MDLPEPDLPAIKTVSLALIFRVRLLIRGDELVVEDGLVCRGSVDGLVEWKEKVTFLNSIEGASSSLTVSDPRAI